MHLPSNYPPQQLFATDNFCIVQLSDLHLSGKIGQAPSYQRFLNVLQHSQSVQPDLYLLTGDLCNDGNLDAYDWVFRALQSTKTPFACIAGNHDVTHEIGIHLPHHQRLHLPLTADARLLSRHRICVQFGHSAWQILLLDSSVSGETYGMLSRQSLEWLDATLSQYPIPSIITLHHHPAPMQSTWIDTYILQNHQDLLKIIAKHAHAQWILCGHVHQAQQLKLSATCQLLSCPSTDRQFLPKQAEFAIDDIPAGYRVIQLTNKQQLASYIKRVQNCPNLSK